MLSKSILRNQHRALFTMSQRAFSVQEYDLAVIGGGPGGYVAAIKAG